MRQMGGHTELTQMLRRFRRRLIGIGAGVAVGWGAVVAVSCLICGTWADVVFELSPASRIGVVTVAGGAGLAWVLAVFAAAIRAGRADGIARNLDRVADTGGEIRSAVDLLREGQSRTPLSRGLAEVAIERAALLAERVPVSQAVPWRPLATAVGSALGVVMVVAVVTMVARPMVCTEYWRFRDPFGDHPPYSRIAFEVAPGNADVIYGGNQEVAVTTTGGPVERLDLVLITAAASDTEEVLPMFGEPGGRWRATIAGLTTPTTYYVRGEGTRSYRYRLGVITLPRLEAVRCRVTPPAYTHRGAYEGPVPQGGIVGLPGTTLQLWARSNRPLDGGRIRMTPALAGGSLEECHDMSPTQAAEPSCCEVTGTIELRSPGRFEIRVRDVDGQESQEAFTASLSLRADERPFVRLLDPPAVVLATADVELPVTMAAEDDCGISRLELFRSLNDSRALSATMPLPALPPTHESRSVILPVPTYGLHAGDEIKLFARVEDNDPAGAKGAESELAVVRIISQADYERLVLARQAMEVLQAKYEQAQQRMEDIARQMEALRKQLATQPADSPLADRMRKELADLGERMRQQAGEMAKAAQSPLPFDIDKKMSADLAALAEKLRQASDRVKELAGAEPAPNADQATETLAAIADSLGQSKNDYEQRTTEPLRHLAKVYPLMQDQQRFTAIYQRQKGLAERLDSLRGKDDLEDPLVRSRMRDLEAEQYQIREDLRQLLQDIEAHVRNLPEDDAKYQPLRETATAFANGVKDSGAVDAMADTESGLAAFSGTRGAEGAGQAEQILRQFLSKCNSTGEQAAACLKFQPNLSDNMGSTVEQLLANAGLNTGRRGEGGGSGYSAHSNTLDNVGLYGHLPALGGDVGGEGQGSRASLPGRLGHEGNFEGSEPGRVDPLESLRAAGAGESVVPLQYLDRVGAYFERITDEGGEKKVRSEK